MIRPATHADTLDLVYLAQQMHAESRYADRPFVDEKVATLVAACINSDEGIALVAVLEGEVVGGFLGGLDERCFNHDKVAFDYGLFVSPDRRGGILAIRMLERFGAWARERGAVPSLGITTGVAPEASARLFQAAGFAPVGTLFEAGR